MGRGDLVDQLELPMRLEQAGVWPDAVDSHPIEVLRRGDQHVGHGPGRQLDDQVVDGIVGSPLHHVERQDVGAHRAERHGQ